MNRWTGPQKRQRFVEARGEAGEAGAALEVGALVGVFDPKAAQEAHDLAVRLAQMLTGLARRA